MSNEGNGRDPFPKRDSQDQEWSQRFSSESWSADRELDRLGSDDPLSERHTDNRQPMEAEAQTLRTRAYTYNDDELEMAIDVKKLGNSVFLRKLAVNGSLIGFWYFFSVSISVYNKWMFGEGQLDFKYPLFTTSMHMLVQFFLSGLVLYFLPHLRPRPEASKSGESPNQSSTEDRKPSKNPIMTTGFFMTRIVPTGAATGLDIGLGNTSLKFATLTFYTMCKSSTLGFVLLFAILFRLEKPSLKIAAIIAAMTVGVILMVFGETEFSGIGFSLIMIASFLSGIRWSLTQILLRNNSSTSNPFSTLFFLTPVMFLVLFLVAMIAEGFGTFIGGYHRLAMEHGYFFSTGILLLPGFLAFLMTASEFSLLKRTSVVTLSVCGIFKEVITIGAGGVIFDDTLTPVNISGLLVTIVAIATYNYIRMKRMREKSMQKAQDAAEENAPMLPTQTHGVEGHDEGRRHFDSNNLVQRGFSEASSARDRDMMTSKPLPKPPDMAR